MQYAGMQYAGVRWGPASFYDLGAVYSRYVKACPEHSLEPSTQAGAHHARGGVMCSNVIGQVATGEAFNVVCRAQDGAPQWAVLESCCMEVVKNNLLCHALHLQSASSPSACEPLAPDHLMVPSVSAV